MTQFTQEQLDAARVAKSPEELIELAKGAGVELTREQAERFLNPQAGELDADDLENVVGGQELENASSESGGCGDTPTKTCPKCGSTNTTANTNPYETGYFCNCKNCGHSWREF